MLKISEALGNHSDGVAVSALYYLARYIKQAAHVQQNFKDIFDDEETSAPSEEVRALVDTIVSNIEGTFQKTLKDLTPNELALCMALISDAERARQPTYSEDEINSANAALRSFVEPEVKNLTI